MTRLDGSLMRSIATLGMIFLPATFVSVSKRAAYKRQSIYQALEFLLNGLLPVGGRRR